MNTTISCSTSSVLGTDPARFRPSRLLTSGYVNVCIHNAEQWIYFAADRPLNELGEIAGAESVDIPISLDAGILAYLAATFEDLFHLTPADWETDLECAAYPITLLRLWETAAGVFRYFTSGKKLTHSAGLDYLQIILSFFNRGPVDCLRGLSLWSLSSARAERVVAEMQRYFHPRLAHGRHHRS